MVTVNLTTTDPMTVNFAHQLREQMAENTIGLRCDEHGGEPDVTITGSSVDDLNAELSACCAALGEVAREALGMMPS